MELLGPRENSGHVYLLLNIYEDLTTSLIVQLLLLNRRDDIISKEKLSTSLVEDA